MSSTHWIIRPALCSDLQEINQLIEQAVMTWDLPSRVKRLAMPSYRYTDLDFQHMDFLLAEDRQGNLLGVAAWEAVESDEIAGETKTILLHGLYVQPEKHKQGIGSCLLKAMEESATKQGFEAVLIKAQMDAIDFFLLQGYRKLMTENSARDFENRLWKALTLHA